MDRINLTHETAGQQRENYHITPYELYHAGKYLLLDCIINIDITRPEFEEGQHERITMYNAQFEKLSDQWENMWEALKKRLEQLEDISFMLGLMEDLYDDIVDMARESQDESLNFPTIRLGAWMMKIYAKKDELEDEDSFINLSASKQDILKGAVREAHNIIDTNFPIVYRESFIGINTAEGVLEEAYKEINTLVEMTKRALDEEI